MAASLQDVSSLLDASKMRYMTDSENRYLCFHNTGESGRSFLLGLSVTSDGSWVQLRSISFSQCLANHPHLNALHRLLATLNYDLRGIKFSWDRQDGEIAAVADLFLGDAQLTSNQLVNWIFFTFHQLDAAHPRVQAVLTSGEDPGFPPPPEELV
jgi:hypothetical protein